MKMTMSCPKLISGLKITLDLHQKMVSHWAKEWKTKTQTYETTKVFFCATTLQQTTKKAMPR